MKSAKREATPDKECGHIDHGTRTRAIVTKLKLRCCFLGEKMHAKVMLLSKLNGELLGS